MGRGTADAWSNRGKVLPMKKLVGVSILVASLALGCAEEMGLRAEPQVVLTAAAVDAPQVPAGTKFAVQMLKSVGTETAEPGELIAAVLLEPLVAADGREVVHAGATLRGNVVRVDSDATPVLVVQFTTVETRSGVAPLGAKLDESARANGKFVEANIVDDQSTFGRAGADAYYVAPNITMAHPSGTGATPLPRYVDPGFTYDDRELVVRVPAGATLHMQLTQPLVVAR